jgi:hypothetical protein
MNREHKSHCCETEVYIGGRNGGRTLRVYCCGCKKLQDTYRFALERWSEDDLDDLDAKFDALVEYLDIEFVFQRISDGSEWGDKESLIVRKKNKK